MSLIKSFFKNYIEQLPFYAFYIFNTEDNLLSELEAYNITPRLFYLNIKPFIILLLIFTERYLTDFFSETVVHLQALLCDSNR